MGTTGGPSGNGPLTGAQAATLYENGTNSSSYNVTATYSLSNQQYTPGEIEGLASNSGMSFGGNINANVNSPMGAFALYSLMNGIGSPTNNLFTSSNAVTAGTGIDITTDHSISLFNCTDALISAATVNQQLLTAKVYYGDLTISFNKAVSNPVLQLVGMGGTVSLSKSGKNYDMGFTTEFDLVSTNVSLSKLSGNTQLAVTPTQITNNATWFGASSVGTASNGVNRYAASGSVVATGTNITSITLKVYIKGDGGRINNGTAVVAADAGVYPVWSVGATNPFGLLTPNVSGDLMLMGVSIQKPVALPVEGLNLSAATNGTLTTLNWVTLNESNTSYFEVERSVDNISFVKTAAHIAAAGTAINTSNYSYKDDISSLQYDVVYYRVRLYDNNGSFRYSNTVVITNKNTGVRIFPNPFVEKVQVTVTVKVAGQVALKLSDISGRTIQYQQQKLTTGTNQLVMAGLTALPKGLYTLEVINTTDNSRTAYKILK
jgi:hypothetical protein